MSPRRYLLLSALVGALPLVALGALDLTLDLLNEPPLPLQLHSVVLSLLALTALVGIGWILLPILIDHVHACGVATGQRLERAKHRDGPTGEVVPIRRPRPHPMPRERQRTM